MGDGGTLVFRSGGSYVGIPREKVQGVCRWRAPRRLPKSQFWLEGLLVEGGELLAVLREDYFGEAAAEPPEVLVLLEEEGRRLAIPGRGAALGQSWGGTREPGDAGQAPARGEGAAEGVLQVIDPRLLYTSLGLLYNETGSNRGS